MDNYYRQASFLTSAARFDQLPPDTGLEVAFAGRSNAGKSSVINRLCDQRGLARISKTPGRTRLLNFFLLDEERRLVDLPGYGYAKVSGAQKRQWSALLDDYLQQRRCLQGLVLVMDCRHPLGEFDRQVIGWSVRGGLPLHILLTKSDKLGRGAAASTLLKVRRELSELQDRVSVQLFSATRPRGLEEALALLNRWLGRDNGDQGTT